MNSKKVLIIGGVGNGTTIAEAIKDANQRGYKEWECVGYLNDKEPQGTIIEGLPVIGKVSDIHLYIKSGYYFIWTIFRLYEKQKRIELFNSLQIPDEKLVSFVHPTAYIADGVKIGAGTVILPNAIISSHTILGKCCFVCGGGSIGHNSIIGSFCHFAPQFCVGSFVKIEDGVNVGMNATILENLLIKKNATIGMGAVLLQNTNESEVWFGNPAKLINITN